MPIKWCCRIIVAAMTLGTIVRLTKTRFKRAVPFRNFAGSWQRCILPNAHTRIPCSNDKYIMYTQDATIGHRIDIMEECIYMVRCMSPILCNINKPNEKRRACGLQPERRRSTSSLGPSPQRTRRRVRREWMCGAGGRWSGLYNIPGFICDIILCVCMVFSAILCARQAFLLPSQRRICVCCARTCHAHLQGIFLDVCRVVLYFLCAIKLRDITRYPIAHTQKKGVKHVCAQQ